MLYPAAQLACQDNNSLKASVHKHQSKLEMVMLYLPP